MPALFALLFFCLLLNAAFVIAELAVVRLSSLGAKDRTPRKQQAKFVETIRSKPARYLAAAQLGISLSSLIIGWCAAGIVSGILTPNGTQIIDAHWASGGLGQILVFILVFGALTVLHSAVAEIIPKSFARDTS